MKCISVNWAFKLNIIDFDAKEYESTRRFEACREFFQFYKYTLKGDLRM